MFPSTNLAKATIVICLLASIGCKKPNKMTTDSTSQFLNESFRVENFRSLVAPGDLLPPSKIKDTEQDEFIEWLSSNSNLFNSTPDETSDKYTECWLKSLKLYGNDKALYIDETLDGMPCLKVANDVKNDVTVTSYVSKMLFQFSCPQGGLKKYLGKNLFESQFLEDASICAGGNASMLYSMVSEMTMTIQTNSTQQQISGRFTDETADMNHQACQTNRTDVRDQWLLPACTTIFRTDYSRLRDTQGNAITTDLPDGSYEKIQLNNVLTFDTTARNFGGGTATFTYNNWQGNVTFGDSPNWSAHSNKGVSASGRLEYKQGTSLTGEASQPKSSRITPSITIPRIKIFR